MATRSGAVPLRPKGRINHLPPSLPPFVADAAELLDLKAVSRTVRPGQEIISEGKRCSSVFLITEGIAIRYRILRDGQRQILKFVLPGDFAGGHNCFFATALFSVKALTHTEISPIPLPKLIGLFDSHPRLAIELFRLFACEATILAEHLIMVGRRSAQERIAHFLLELLVRLQRIGLADDRSYRLPITQEMIGDALGLSVPYVNRVLQQLRHDGLVTIKDQLVVIEDIEELSDLADSDQLYLKPLSIAELLAEPS